MLGQELGVMNVFCSPRVAESEHKLKLWAQTV